MGSAEAKALADRQRHYDRLHHLMRIEWLEGLPVLDHFHFGLLKQSRAIIERPVMGYNSVDMNDAEYIAELDAYAAAKKAAA